MLALTQGFMDKHEQSAEGFAYLAVRSVLGLPLTLPNTTGAPEALTGGVLHEAGKK